jgi:hypothetical protein
MVLLQRQPDSRRQHDWTEIASEETSRIVHGHGLDLQFGDADVSQVWDHSPSREQHAIRIQPLPASMAPLPRVEIPKQQSLDSNNLWLKPASTSF